MARDFAKQFYATRAWRECAKAYKKSVGGLCEPCRDNGQIVPGEIVHHKEHLTPENINDPEVALNWDNLELVCRECHAKEHGAKQKRYIVDEWGNVYIPHEFSDN